jgi:hypothetical protein
MARALVPCLLIVAVAGCESPPTSITACQLVQDPSPHLGKTVAIDDVALSAPSGTIAITAIRGCRIQNIQGIELDLSEAEPESAELLRRNLAEAQRRSRPNNALGVAGRFTGTVEPGYEDALSLRLQRAENQQLRRADDMLQPGLFNAMQAEPDSLYVSNTIR